MAALANRLAQSGKTGLLGAPLPQGATLLERTAGDPAAGRDPSERYAVSASAPEIAAFYNETMLAAGWKKGGDSTATLLFFEKGSFVLGVLVNRDRFTLRGS